jgi:hypothetical protein
MCVMSPDPDRRHARASIYRGLDDFDTSRQTIMRAIAEKAVEAEGA